ncbi:MAG TPA: hypothetical protein VGF99_03635 [Myxococcota bacterium]
MGFPLAISPCASSAIELHLLADGEIIDAAVAADIRGHVAGCVDCRSAWQGLIGTRRLLTTPVAAIPLDLLESLHAITDAA